MTLKICTINVPDSYLECMDVLVEMGFYPSRSEAVRIALKQFIGREATLFDSLDPDFFESLKQEQIENYYKMQKRSGR